MPLTSTHFHYYLFTDIYSFSEELTNSNSSSILSIYQEQNSIQCHCLTVQPHWNWWYRLWVHIKKPSRLKNMTQLIKKYSFCLILFLTLSRLILNKAAWLWLCLGMLSNTLWCLIETKIITSNQIQHYCHCAMNTNKSNEMPMKCQLLTRSANKFNKVKY